MTTEQLSLFYPESQAEKKCSKCGINKKTSEFNKNRTKKDGFSTECKCCVNLYNTGYWKDNKRELSVYHVNHYQENKERIHKRAKIYRSGNKEKIALGNKRYREENKQVLRRKEREHYHNNKERILERQNEYQRIYRTKPEIKERFNKWCRDKRKKDPQYKLQRNIAGGINLSLKGMKAGRHWETLVDYTLNDLKKHLEKRFTEGMSWENYGDWHVDHKIPLSVHNFISTDDIDFKKAWALSNLQPLWAKDNISKHASIDKPFQPSLAFG